MNSSINEIIVINDKGEKTGTLKDPTELPPASVVGHVLTVFDGNGNVSEHYMIAETTYHWSANKWSRGGTVIPMDRGMSYEETAAFRQKVLKNFGWLA